MPPEVKDAIEWYKMWRVGKYDYDDCLATRSLNNDRRIIAEYYLDQYTQQPVDWPTEPGDYWMEYERDGVVGFDPQLCKHDGKLIIVGTFYFFTREDCEEQHARFLPAHLPTFPPREPME